MQTFKRDCKVIVDVADLASSNNKSVIHVLHVDDDPSILEISKQILMDMGNFEIDHAYCVDEALKKLATGQYDVVISDYEMPQKDGIQFLKELRKQNNGISFMLFTGKGREEVAINALNLGADGYYNKQGNPETVYGELAHDIKLSVERKKAEEASKKQAALIDLSPDAIIVKNMDETITFWNAGAERLYGYTKQEALGQKINILLKAKHSKLFDGVITQLRQGKSWTGEITNYTKNNNEVTVQSYWSATLNAQGGIVEILESNVDITERKKMEEALRKNEEKYRELVEQSMQGILIAHGPIPHIVFANSAMSKILGYSVQELTSLSPQQVVGLVHPDDRDLFFGRFKERLEGKPSPTQYGIRGIRKDGTIVWVELSSALIEYGGQPAVQAMFTDITERKKAEEEIKFQADLLNHIGQAVMMVDSNRTIRFWNKAAEKLYGWSEEQALGHKVTELLGGTLSEEADEAAKRLMAGESLSTEVLAENRDGSVVPVILNRTPIFNEDGEFVGVASIAADITLQKNTEADLTLSLISLSSSLDKIEELNEKLRVVGGLTRHDVRNKLSAVTGYAYILKKKHGDQADIVDGLGKVEQAVQETVRIFDFAKMYEQMGEEELTYIDVEEKLKEAAALFSGPIPTIMNECHGLTVLADSFLRQIFFNFIDNTRKYGVKTTIIRVYFERADQDSLKLVYEDDGVGVPSENKPRLFKEGYSTGGSTGFGLFLTKRMMDVYDWQIQENGTPGEGAKFTITIPKLSKSGKENYQIAQ